MQQTHSTMLMLTALFKENTLFIRLVLVITCTTVVLVLLVAGTATTAISFPPQPPFPTCHCHNNRSSIPEATVLTALDGKYKLLGPLLIMAGGFLLILDIFLFGLITREIYTSSVHPIKTSSGSIPPEEPMSVLGGPFYLAVPTSGVNSMLVSYPGRNQWIYPNAPTPDFLPESINGKSKVRPASATVSKGQQPPFNPESDIQ